MRCMSVTAAAVVQQGSLQTREPGGSAGPAHRHSALNSQAPLLLLSTAWQCCRRAQQPGTAAAALNKQVIIPPHLEHPVECASGGHGTRPQSN